MQDEPKMQNDLPFENCRVENLCFGKNTLGVEAQKP